MGGVKKNCGIEILRILSMYAIILYHLRFALKPYISMDCVTDIISSFGIMGVNSFFAISAYYLTETTSLKKESFFSILKTFIVYDGIFYVFSIIETIINKQDVFSFVLSTEIDALKQPIWTDRYWYVSLYLFMLLLIPYYNKLLSRLEKIQVRFLLCVLVVVMISAIFECESGVVFDIAYFSYIYMVVYYLKKHYENYMQKHCTKIAVIAFLLIVIARIVPYYYEGKMVSVFVFLFGNIHRHSIIMAILGICIFWVFKGIKMEKISFEKIRRLSKLTCGVYLFHENPLFNICSKVVGILLPFFIYDQALTLLLAAIIILVSGLMIEQIKEFGDTFINHRRIIK